MTTERAEIMAPRLYASADRAVRRMHASPRGAAGLSRWRHWERKAAKRWRAWGSVWGRTAEGRAIMGAPPLTVAERGVW